MPKFVPGEFATKLGGFYLLPKDANLLKYEFAVCEIIEFMGVLPKDSPNSKFGHKDWYEVEMGDLFRIWCREIVLEKIPPPSSSQQLFDSLFYTPPDRRTRAAVPINA